MANPGLGRKPRDTSGFHPIAPNTHTHTHTLTHTHSLTGLTIFTRDCMKPLLEYDLSLLPGKRHLLNEVERLQK